MFAVCWVSHHTCNMLCKKLCCFITPCLATTCHDKTAMCDLFMQACIKNIYALDKWKHSHPRVFDLYQAKELLVKKAVGCLGWECIRVRVGHGTCDWYPNTPAIQSTDVIHLLPVHWAILHFHLCDYILGLKPSCKILHRQWLRNHPKAHSSSSNEKQFHKCVCVCVYQHGSIENITICPML